MMGNSTPQPLIFELVMRINGLKKKKEENKDVKKMIRGKILLVATSSFYIIRVDDSEKGIEPSSCPAELELLTVQLPGRPPRQAKPGPAARLVQKGSGGC